MTAAHVELSATLEEFSASDSQAPVSSDEANGEGPKPENQSGKLGVTLEPLTPQIARRLGFDSDSEGMVVTDVDQNAPAAESGINQGDVILEINRKPINSVADVTSALSGTGDRPVLLLISRRGQTIFLTVKPEYTR